MVLVRSLLYIQVILALLLISLGGFVFDISLTKTCFEAICLPQNLQSINVASLVIAILLVFTTKKLKPVIWGSSIGALTCLITGVIFIWLMGTTQTMSLALAMVQMTLGLGFLIFNLYSEHKGFFELKKSRSNVGNQHTVSRWLSNGFLVAIILATYLNYTTSPLEVTSEVSTFFFIYIKVIFVLTITFSFSMIRISLISTAMTLFLGGIGFYLNSFPLLMVVLVSNFAFMMKNSFYLKSLRMVGQAEGPSYLEDILDLAKPRLSSLVIFTATLGMLLAPGEMGFINAVLGILATTGVVAGSCAINCYMERDVDKLMLRTANRPLPRNRIPASHGLFFGIACHVIFLALLYFATNPLTTILAAVASLFYLAFYTPMKRRSSWAVVVGAVPGAIPPLMGWTMVTNNLDITGLILFAILFVWQIPHFMAIATFRMDEYERAGLIVTPIVSGLNATRYWVFVTTIILAIVSFLPLKYSTHGNSYLIFSTLLGAAFLALAFYGLFIQNETKVKCWAKRYFWGSIIYLPVLFIGLVILS